MVSRALRLPRRLDTADKVSAGPKSPGAMTVRIQILWQAK